MVCDSKNESDYDISHKLHIYLKCDFIKHILFTFRKQSRWHLRWSIRLTKLLLHCHLMRLLYHSDHFYYFAIQSFLIFYRILRLVIFFVADYCNYTYQNWFICSGGASTNYHQHFSSSFKCLYSVDRSLVKYRYH